MTDKYLAKRKNIAIITLANNHHNLCFVYLKSSYFLSLQDGITSLLISYKKTALILLLYSVKKFFPCKDLEKLQLLTLFCQSII